ncbi:hypothetical protein AGLY_000495 [Aphis glycines]|uniref:Uncharacterized protein n=1 Tax=Aphis glycines TaxID=307491 RepID=A0A6G0U9J0_APHGL|nr:hypothetical protein AGLY_000495 [Aphis glycines]
MIRLLLELYKVTYRMEWNNNSTHKFVIVDFEFTTINKTSIVLLSGAISNTLDRFKIRKLEGRPLLLPLDEEVRPMKDQEFCLAIREINRIFKCKTEFRDVCLDQLNKCLKTKINNLTPIFIENYYSKSDKINVLVVWNGDSNEIILRRLGIKQFPILSITCNDTLFNQTYSIQLKNVQTKEIIFEVEIGILNSLSHFVIINASWNNVFLHKNRDHTRYDHEGTSGTCTSVTIWNTSMGSYAQTIHTSHLKTKILRKLHHKRKRYYVYLTNGRLGDRTFTEKLIINIHIIFRTVLEIKAVVKGEKTITKLRKRIEK